MSSLETLTLFQCMSSRKPLDHFSVSPFGNHWIISVYLQFGNHWLISVYVQLETIESFQCMSSSETILYVAVFFIHLKLIIASAMPTSNE